MKLIIIINLLGNFMDLSVAINNLGNRRATTIAKTEATAHGLVWGDGIGAIFNAILANPGLAPSISRSPVADNIAIRKWVNKYVDGFNSRISQRTSNMPATVPDPIINSIISSKLPNLLPKHLTEIKDAHRLSMSAENILGLLLEEYIAITLLPHGWYCAWGETLRHVDFCHTSGRLLQVKNRSNTENSSSSRVRLNTPITNWYRVNANNGNYEWLNLNNLTGVQTLNEPGFSAFVNNTLKNNPDALAIEINNLWAQNPLVL